MTKKQKQIGPNNVVGNWWVCVTETAEDDKTFITVDGTATHVGSVKVLRQPNGQLAELYVSFYPPARE